MGQTSLSLSDWHTNCVKVCMCVSSGCDTFEIEMYLKQRGSVNFEKCEELLSTVCHPTFGQAALSNALLLQSHRFPWRRKEMLPDSQSVSLTARVSGVNVREHVLS